MQWHLFKLNVLIRTRDSATEVVDELMQYKWIDGLTRAVFVEFLLYNPNVNLYAISMLNFEFPETGGNWKHFCEYLKTNEQINNSLGNTFPCNFTGCFVYYKFHIMRLDRYVGAYTYVIIAAEIGVALFLLYFMIREFRKWLKQRKQYFKVKFARTPPELYLSAFILHRPDTRSFRRRINKPSQE